MIEKVRKLAVKIENNSDKIEIGMAIALLVVVILSVIPLYVFGYYTVPVADDYNMILKTHSAWESSHSIWQVFTAALATAKGPDRRLLSALGSSRPHARRPPDPRRAGQPA